MKKVVVIFLVISNAISAQNEIVTDRPDVTESAITIPFKSLQFETGITYLDENKAENFTLPEFLIRVGVLKFLELRVENSFYKVNNQINNSDLFLGVKVQLLKNKRFNLAFLSHVNLPEQHREDILFIGKVLASYELNDKAEIAINLGVADLNKDNNGAFVYSIAYGRSITNKMSFYIESFGSVKNGEIHSFLDGGFAFLLKNKIQLDAKFGIDIQYFKDYFVGAGISFRVFN